MAEKIIMIDDEPERLVSHVELLEDEGYEVKCLSDIDEGIEVIRNYSLIILDLNMPPKRSEKVPKNYDTRQTGVLLHKEIRKALHIKTHIIFMSVVRDEKIWDEIRECENSLGFYNIQYFKIPVRPRVLVEAVNKELRKK